MDLKILLLRAEMSNYNLKKKEIETYSNTNKQFAVVKSNQIDNKINNLFLYLKSDEK